MSDANKLDAKRYANLKILVKKEPEHAVIKKREKPYSAMTPEMQVKAIELAAQGLTQERIREIINVEHTVFWQFKISNPSWLERYDRARQEGLEELSDTLETIPDIYVDVQRGRLKSDNIKWLLAKRRPDKYGDRIDVNVTKTVDINLALDEARKRAAIRHGSTNDVIEAQHHVINEVVDKVTTDSKSVNDHDDTDAMPKSLADLLGEDDSEK